jgi:hypothetical protein
MIIGSVQRIRNLSREPSLFLGNVKLKRVKHKKILGVTVDENLSWHDHISNTVILTIVHRYGITAIKVLKRNFRNYKIVLAGLSHVLVMILDLRKF